MARKSRKPQANHETPKTPVFAAWGYARISNDNGEKSEDSIDNQTAIIEDYVKDRDDLDLRGVITDLGFSGRDFDRPGYVELMDKIQRGEVTCVVSKDLSRIGRSYIEVGELLFDIFPAHGVRYISVTDNYDSFADDANRKKLLILFKNLVNHMYSLDVGKKIRSVCEAKKQRGEALGLPPYGYLRSDNGKSYVIDPEAAEIVRRIFYLRLSGESIHGIAKRFNQEGIMSAQNLMYQRGLRTHEAFSKRIIWTATMVSSILCNEVYIGTLFCGKYHCVGKKSTLLPKDQWIRFEGAHPAIIDKEIFEDVQELLRESSEKYKKGKPRTANIPENRYSGVMFCSRCGKAMKRTSSLRGENPLFYYVCRDCLDYLKHEQGIKRAPNYPLAVLDDLVIRIFRSHADSLLDLDMLIESLSGSDALSSKRALLLRDKSKFEKSFYDADRRFSAAYTHHLDGLLDKREFELIRSAIEREKHEAEAALGLVIAKLKKFEDFSERHSRWRKLYDDFKSMETPTKEFIQTFISQIQITPITNEIEIVLNYADGLGEYRKLLIEGEVSA